MKKAKGRGPSRTETWVPTDRPLLVWINVCFYVDRCVHRVYYGYLAGCGKTRRFWEGHEFTRAVKSLKMCRASAPEVSFLRARRVFPQPARGSTPPLHPRRTEAKTVRLRGWRRPGSIRIPSKTGLTSVAVP